MRTAIGLGMFGRPGAGAVAPFYPLTYGTPVAIFRADKQFTAAQWNDQSGNGYHLTQATAGQQGAATTAGTNVVPAVKFTRASVTRYQTAAFSSALLASTIVLICDFDATGDQSMCDGLTTGSRQVIDLNGVAASSLYAGALVGDATAPLTALTHRVAVFSGAASTYWTQGVKRFTANPGTNSMDGLTLGDRFASLGVSSNSKIVACYVYRGVLSDANIAALYAQDLAYCGTGI